MTYSLSALDDDFETRYAQLGLESDLSVDATFTPGKQLPPAEPVPTGTLPRLTLATPDAALEPGEDKPELVVVEVLGEGGMGRVVLARQHSLGREVAVELLKSQSKAGAHALVEEARTTGSLEHPGVVPVYALARDAAGLPALVMKRVDGVSWRELLHDDRHPAWARIAPGRDRLGWNLEVLIQVCNAIAHAHLRGVIHRDLKPANILIGELGEVYVADWGVATQKAALEPGPPRLVGTPAYLAPEMVTGDPSMTDERTDIYLLGGTLHEVLTQRPTHLGSSIHDVLEKAWNAAPPTLPATVPAELAQLCQKALAPDPRERFQSAVAMRDARRLFLQHRGSIALATVASARLQKLEALAKTPLNAEAERGWYALVSECRFAFGQALEADPQSGVAIAGLEQCLAVATARELERGAPAAARAFLAEMKAPPAALAAALRALDEKEAERAIRDARFSRFAHELDPMVSRRERDRLMIVLVITVLAVVGLFGTMGVLHAPLSSLLGKWVRLVPMGVLCLAYFACLAVGRRSLLATRINRQLIGICILSSEVSRVEFVMLDVPHHISLIHDSWTLVSLMVLCGVLLHWGFAVPGLFFAASAIAIGAAPPEHAVKIFSILSSIAMFSSMAMFRAWRKDFAAAVLK